MKKIALALIALVAVLSPLAAGESWIGVTTGPSFDIQKQGDADAFTDFGWDVNVEGTYYFNEAETIGLGVKLGVGFNYDSTYSVSLADTIISATAAAGASSDSSQASHIVSLINGANLPSIKNPSAGIKLAPAITFQYRLALTENLDLRLGAGLQYIHTFGNGIDEKLPTTLASHFGEKVSAEFNLDALEIIANADVAYSLGDFQIFGGVDLGFTVMTHYSMVAKAAGQTIEDKHFITDGFGFSITPRVGVSYAF